MKSKLALATNDDQKAFWKTFRPINRVTASDTYKRTMGCANETFAQNFVAYNLSARRALKEEGANGRLIVAGLEKTLYPWFIDEIETWDIKRAKDFFETRTNVKRFVDSAWKRVKENSGRMPIDIYGLPGGQTILAKDGKYIPIMSVEGIGALASHIEPALEQMYSSIIQATKARLFSEVTTQLAEVGVRGDRNFNEHTASLIAMYVGGGINLTSNDQAVYLFPELFRDIGTMGHEFVQSYQRKGLSLEEAQYMAFEDFVQMNERSALLADTIDTVRSGFPAAIKIMKKYESSRKIIMPRLDSGDVVGQSIIWKKMTLEAGIKKTQMIVEDGYTPGKARETKKAYAAHGFDPEDIIVGAGGYFQEGVTRDAISFVYKRGATEHGGVLEPSIKFSDDIGKGSIPGVIRVYERGSSLIVAQKGEYIDGTPLYVPLVENGNISYYESLREQRERANKTWGRYETVEYSPATQELIEKRRAELHFAKASFGGAK